MRASTTSLILVWSFFLLVGLVHTTLSVPATTISFSLNDVDVSEQDGFHILNVEGCHLAGEPGQPYLPCKAVNFVIPRGQGVARVRVEVEGKERIPENYYIYPAQTPRPTGDGFGDDDFVDPDVDIYGSIEPFPGIVVEEGRTAMAWGWKTYQVTVWPLEYIPARREIWFNETVKISLELSPGAEDEQEILARTRQQHEDWAEELEQAMANPEDVCLLAPNVFSPITGPGRWVLILPGNPETLESDTWIDTFQPLIDHRQNQGLDVEYIYVRQITSASGEAAVQDIRNYLKEQHEYHGARWACLVGDHNMIPWTYRCLPIESQSGDWDWIIPNDWCYSDLDGSWPWKYDWAPELWVGRIPSMFKYEGENFVEKVLAYENTTDSDYALRALYESADQMTDDGQCEYVMVHEHSSINSTLQLEEPSGSSMNPTEPTPGDIVNLLNANLYHYYTVYCHGGPNSFATMSKGYCLPSSQGGEIHNFDLTHMAQLTNEDYYLYWYSVSCRNASLDIETIPPDPDPIPAVRTIAEGSTCMYERNGAVAFGGNTRFGWVYPRVSRDLQCHAWDILFEPFVPWYFNYAGAVEALHKWRYSNQSSGDYPDYVRYSHNLFGDPATRIWAPGYMPPTAKPMTAEIAPKPPRIHLLGCAPIPASNSTTVEFSIDRTSDVSMGLYDIGGHLVRDFGVREFEAGRGSQRCDCSSLASGMYVIRIAAGGTEKKTRLVVMR